MMLQKEEMLSLKILHRQLMAWVPAFAGMTHQPPLGMTVMCKCRQNVLSEALSSVGRFYFEQE